MRSSAAAKSPRRTLSPASRREALLFAATIFLSAFLLFQVEPLLAKYILPWYGGTPAVWTTCLLFFQTVLLAGYAYAHGLRRASATPRQGRAHTIVLFVSVAVLLAMTFLWPSPITPGAFWKPSPDQSPIAHILLFLAAGVGLPYLILASTGPLLQHWYARLWPDSSPYRLYAVSNLGSLLGLLTYPFLFEPLLTIRGQARLWALGYLVFVGGCGWCADRAARLPGEAPREEVASPGLRPTEVMLWFLLAACGSLMLLATTNLMTQDVAAVPFLWIVPLGLYLLSFIVVFAGRAWYQRWLWHPLFALAAMLAVLALLGEDVHPPLRQLSYLGFVLLAACMTMHGELSRRQPATRHLTAYYLVIAAGGAAGAAFTTLLAPRIFPAFWEFHLGVWLTTLLLAVALYFDPDSWLHARRAWAAPALVLGLLALFAFTIVVGWATIEDRLAHWATYTAIVAAVWLALALVFARAALLRWRWVRLVAVAWLVLLGYVLLSLAQARPGELVDRARNFYGVLSVWDVFRGNPQLEAFKENNGHIHHGMQLQAPALRQTATSYYGVASGAGLALLYHPNRLASPPQPMRIGAVGMGVGTIAVYAQPGDTVRFYEINPAVIRFAHSHFSYLSASKGDVQVVEGDARLSLERELARGEPQNFDVLIVDAFSSDAIPVHLLTAEAFAIYLDHLRAPQGIIAVHVTNRSLDLEPVVAAAAEHFHLYSIYVHSPAQGIAVIDADWILLSRSRAILDTPEIASSARPLVPAGDFRLWTDQYSNLYSVLK